MTVNRLADNFLLGTPEPFGFAPNGLFSIGAQP
jgi:hypothetical protein